MGTDSSELEGARPRQAVGGAPSVPGGPLGADHSPAEPSCFASGALRWVCWIELGPARLSLMLPHWQLSDSLSFSGEIHAEST